MSDEFPSAKILADSITADGHRLTTFEVVFNRFVLAEFNTHRTLSRNSASSRAIPVSKQIKRVVEKLAGPLVWPSEQKGMQGGEPLSDRDQVYAEQVWHIARTNAMTTAEELVRLGVHKSIVNRLLEPFMRHTAVVTATAWQNFFDQRCSPLAQPEIKAVADLMREAYVKNEPVSLKEGEWHLPYIEQEDVNEIIRRFFATAADPEGRGIYPEALRYAAQVSAARCARTSYLTQDGVRDIQEDLNLFSRLRDAFPPHWSPLEHPATPWPENRQPDLSLMFDGGDNGWVKVVKVANDHLPVVGNLVGWRSLRTEEEATLKEVTFR